MKKLRTETQRSRKKKKRACTHRLVATSQQRRLRRRQEGRAGAAVALPAAKRRGGRAQQQRLGGGHRAQCRLQRLAAACAAGAGGGGSKEAEGGGGVAQPAFRGGGVLGARARFEEAHPAEEARRRPVARHCHLLQQRLAQKKMKPPNAQTREHLTTKSGGCLHFKKKNALVFFCEGQPKNATLCGVVQCLTKASSAFPARPHAPSAASSAAAVGTALLSASRRKS
jgi:hypothetical protein